MFRSVATRSAAPARSTSESATWAAISAWPQPVDSRVDSVARSPGSGGMSARAVRSAGNTPASRGADRDDTAVNAGPVESGAIKVDRRPPWTISETSERRAHQRRDDSPTAPPGGAQERDFGQQLADQPPRLAPIARRTAISRRASRRAPAAG